MNRSADSRHYIFALRVGEIVAVENFFAGAGVAREAHARSGVVAGIAEHHLHDVDGCAEQTGDFFYAAIGDGFFRHPRTEHRADGPHNCSMGSSGKSFPAFSLK